MVFACLRTTKVVVQAQRVVHRQCHRIRLDPARERQPTLKGRQALTGWALGLHGELSEGKQGSK